MSFLFLIIAFFALIFSLFLACKKKFKKSCAIFLLCLFLFCCSIVLSEGGKEFFSLLNMTHQISGNAGDSLENYEKVLTKKCNGPALQTCHQASQSLSDIQICMFSKYAELSGECGMFLSNTSLTYPPLNEDKMVTGILLPKGTIVHLNQGYIIWADIPKPWKFDDKSCDKGPVNFTTWAQNPDDKRKVDACKDF